MAIFDTKSTGGNRSNDERPSANLWLNVGVTLDVVQEDGTTKQEFISLPVGIPLDTTEPMDMRGSNKSWLEKVQTKNALLEFAQKTAAGLDAGAGEIIDNFQIQVYKRADATVAPSKADNGLLEQLNKMNFG